MRSFLIFKLIPLVICAPLLLAGCGGSEETAIVPEPEPVVIEKETPVRDSLTFELTGVDSVTVFDLLLGAHQVEYRASLTGTFVTGIDSVTVGDGYFWVYSVNDSMAQVACDDYFTRSGDRVKWHFRDLSR